LSGAADFDGNGFIGKGCTVGEMVKFPLPAFCHDRVQNPDEVAAPDYMEQCLGSTTPTRTFGLNTSITFRQRLTFDILGEGMGGHWLSSGTAYQNARREVWPMCRSTVDAIAAGNRETLTAGERAQCDRSVTRYGTWTDYEGVDPEAFEDGSAEVLFRQEYYNLPPIRSFQFSVKIDF
jgi:hypothetical protein